MELKNLAFAALAAFAFGAGINTAPAEAAGNCFVCHDNCDSRFDACLAAGTAPDICVTRVDACHRSCGCPTP